LSPVLRPQKYMVCRPRFFAITSSSGRSTSIRSSRSGSRSF
jgi:hypothetical protein